MYDLVWYKTLIQPPFSPPSWVFPPAWTLLYFTMFFAVLIYAIKPHFGNKNWGYFIFFCQLALNFCWSPVFFVFRNIGMALAIIVILAVFVILNIAEFFKVSKTSGLLLIPYLLWLLYALYLNAGIFVLN